MLKNPALGLLALSLLALGSCAGPEPAADSASGDRASTPDSRGVPAGEMPDAGSKSTGPGTDATARPTGQAALEALRTDILALELRDEHDARRVQVQHILVSFAGRGVPGVSRTQEEAEQLTAELYQRILAGEDFATLMAEFSDDTGGGTYAMHSGQAPRGEYPRNGMVPAFGNTGWRLQVGQVGVAPFEPRRSPYGWHIVKRID